MQPSVPTTQGNSAGLLGMKLGMNSGQNYGPTLATEFVNADYLDRSRSNALGRSSRLPDRNHVVTVAQLARAQRGPQDNPPVDRHQLSYPDRGLAPDRRLDLAASHRPSESSMANSALVGHHGARRPCGARPPDGEIGRSRSSSPNAVFTGLRLASTSSRMVHRVAHSTDYLGLVHHNPPTGWAICSRHLRRRQTSRRRVFEALASTDISGTSRSVHIEGVDDR